jgi:hypothetical protein
MKDFAQNIRENTHPGSDRPGREKAERGYNNEKSSKLEFVF